MEIFCCVIEMLCKPVFLILLAGWTSALVLLLWFGCQRYKRVYRTKWYDLSKKGPNKEMEWCQIRQLMKRDPMQDQDRLPCRLPGWYFLIDIFGAIVLISIFCGSFRLICDFQNWDTKDSVVVGVLTLAVSIATIFYNVRRLWCMNRCFFG